MQLLTEEVTRELHRHRGRAVAAARGWYGEEFRGVLRLDIPAGMLTTCPPSSVMLERRHRPGGNSRGNPVMSHGKQAGQAPDQANEGGQAGARSTGDKPLLRYIRKRSGMPRVTQRRQHQTWPALPVGIARTSEAILTGRLMARRQALIPSVGHSSGYAGSPGRQGSAHRGDRSGPCSQEVPEQNSECPDEEMTTGAARSAREDRGAG